MGRSRVARRRRMERTKTQEEFEAREKPVMTSVNMEVETFKLFGCLKRTKTEIHNHLPTATDIKMEKEMQVYDERRKATPDAVKHKDYFTNLVDSYKIVQ